MTGTPHQIHDSTGKVVATLPDMRTRHGIVQYRTTADGIPVAVVSERSTYNHDVDPVLAFAQMNDPTAIHGPSDFIDAFSKQNLTFNWFYVDTREHRDVLLRRSPDPRQRRRSGPAALG